MLTAEMSKKFYYSSYIFIYSVVGCEFFSSFLFSRSVAMVVDFMITINSTLLRTLKKITLFISFIYKYFVWFQGFFLLFF